MWNSTSRRCSPATLALFVLSFLGSCGGGTGGSTSNVFVLGNSGFAAAANTPLAVDGAWLVFLADEAASGGQDLNGDGGAPIDSVAIAVNTATEVETNLGVAAVDAAWVGEELYIVVDEVADNFDHGGAIGISDLVLMHWNSMSPAPAFVDTMDRASNVEPLVVVGSTLFYASGNAPVMGGDSSLRAIDEAFPEIPRPVFTQDLANTRSPILLGEDEGLVLLALDETVEGVALNGDGKADDTHILALLDGTGAVQAGGYSLLIRDTGLALPAAASSIVTRAANQAANDWLVGFLVDEGQEERNLNVFDGIVLPASWQIGACSVADSDQTDLVLHVIRFSAWDVDPVGNPPVNTGLAGSSRILIVGDAVGTLCREADENNCVFNNDGDATDTILRWIRVDSNVAPFSSTGPVRALSQLVALDTALPGPALAAAELDGALVVQVDEAADGRDHDNAPGTNRNLVAWLDPQDAGPAWVFDSGTTGPVFATATWMGEQPQHTLLGVAFDENSNGADLNGDGDTLDSMPTWADISGSPRQISFTGRFLAADRTNAGITLAGGTGFFRFSEAEDGRDINGNGNATDILLVRVDLTSGVANNMGILNTLTRPAMESESDGTGDGAAFLFDEGLIGTDLNGDGDAVDLVPRFFELP